jgi:hypothetical protein
MPKRQHSKPLEISATSDVTSNSGDAVVCTLCRQPACRAVAAKTMLEALSEETLRKLWAGKLSQTCPSYGHVEPAGLCCSNCSGAVQPTDWSPDTRKQRTATENRQTARPGHYLEAA